jgi:Xaa-Pro dipeptidase
MPPYDSRRRRLQAILDKAGLSAAAFVPGVNFQYLTGLHFHLMERPTLLILTREGEVLAIMPELERQKWSTAFPNTRTAYWQDKDGYEAAFAWVREALGQVEIGVEGQRMRVFEGNALRRHFGVDGVRDIESELAPLRLCKDADEIAATQEAIDISERALAETYEAVRTGWSERRIAAFLKARLLEGGAEGFAFQPIVLTGPNAANPHGVSGERELVPGDALLIDFGAMAGDYNADITRTAFCGHASDRHAEIYATVLAANSHGRAIAGPNRTAHEMDSEVTGVLAASPFSSMILHKTGHGLGLDIHEAPQIMIGNHVPLPPGTLFTIEPGLYAEGEIGVRIEDDVVTEQSGSRSLTGFPRELTLVGIP